MTASPLAAFTPTDLLRIAARVLVLAWGGFWVWFAVASAVAEFRTEGVGASVMHGLQAVVFLAVVVAAWRWDLAGGVLLLGLAALGAWFFHPRHLATALLLLGPPTVAGAFLLIHALLSHLAHRPGG
jgi:hypothetical protein